MPLRSNSANSPSRRANWKALGLSAEDMEKPKIAVVNSSSELAICYAHLDGIAKMVKEEIRAAGGVPFEVRVADRQFARAVDHRDLRLGHVLCGEAERLPVGAAAGRVGGE